MKLYIVRHGETDWNKARKIQGQSDIPLNEFGRHLARETAKGLADVHFDLCFTSPLSRAKETAQIILDGRDVPIIEEPRIEEMAFGEYEGKCCSSEGWELPEEFRRFFDGPDRYRAPAGGEDFGQVRDRTGEFLEDLARDPKYEGKQILITTHGAALAGLLCYIRKAPLSQYWGAGVHKNCAVTEVDCRDGKFQILSENVVYYKDEVEPWAK